MSGIYIHIPFCRQICHYCDFHHSASLTHLDSMIEAIRTEIAASTDYIHEPRTLYFGGGTPSVCSPEQLGRLISQVRTNWPTATLEEITLEANPDDLTTEYLDNLRQIGINRLSIGIQSFDPDQLRTMNRRHTPNEARQAVRRAQRAGFDNITIDLMYGLPGMTLVQWQGAISQALELDVQHISAYHLTIEEHTVFGKRRIQPIDTAMSEQQYLELHKRLEQAGFHHYEISNFALPGYESQHNSSYWDSTPYLGVGPSAHSFNGSSRRWNVSSNRQYLLGTAAQIEILTPRDRYNEFLMTRLRTARGIDRTQMEQHFAPAIVNRLFDMIAPSKSGLRVSQDRIHIDPSDFLISDSIISSLFEL